MEFIPLLRLRKNALRDCADAEELPLERRLKLRENLKVLDIAPWVSKGLVLTAIVFGVNWKKTVPMTKRELPLAVGAIAFCAVTDYLTSEWVWQQHMVEIVRLTGFKGGIYVSPERMRKMRAKMKITDLLREEDDLLIEDDPEPSK